MRSRLSGLVGISLMLAVALGFTAIGPTEVAAQNGNEICSYSVGADGVVNFDGAGASRVRCQEILASAGLAEPTAPGSTCNVIAQDGKIVSEKGQCPLAPDTDGDTADATDADATDADATDADATDADATDADATDADATDADATDADATDADATDADATDADATDADATDVDTGGGKATPGEEEAGATSLPSTGTGEQTGSSLMTLTVGFVAAAAVLGTTGLLISRDRRTN